MSAITASITGIILEAKTAVFQDDDGKDQTYGKIQVMTPDMSGEFQSITNIKVKKEAFGFLPDIAAMKGKKMTLPLEAQEFKGKTSYYLSASNMPRPQSRAS
jgi:hypothetical protein